jgi:hypothetical protein
MYVLSILGAFSTSTLQGEQKLTEKGARNTKELGRIRQFCHWSIPLGNLNGLSNFLPKFVQAISRQTTAENVQCLVI